MRAPPLVIRRQSESGLLEDFDCLMPASLSIAFPVKSFEHDKNALL
jgi:hypothetical protein